MNKTVGAYFNDSELSQKLDSLYSPAQFERLQEYAPVTGGAVRLQGVIFVTGRLGLPEGLRLEIADGALITDGTVILGAGSSVAISHSASTRTLPGLMVLDNGALILGPDAQLRVQGLVYTSRVFEIREGARADVVGAVLGADRELGFRSSGAKVVIRYDPAVLGTPGLRTPDNSPVVAWVASWEELP